MQKKVNRSALRWVYQVSGNGKGWVVLLALVRILLSLCVVSFALMLRSVVDSAVAGDKQGLITHLFYFLLLVIVTVVSMSASRHLTEKAKATIEKSFRMRLFSQLLSRDYASVTALHTGEWSNRLTSDAQTVANAAVDIVPGVCSIAVRLIAALYLLIEMAPSLVFILLPACLLIGSVAVIFRGRMKLRHKQAQAADGLVRTYMQERLSSLMVVRTFTREQASESEAAERMDRWVDARMKRIAFANICQTGLHSSLEFARLLAIALCSWGIFQGTMTYGTMSAVLQLVAQLEMPFVNLSGLLPQFYAMLASAERMMEAEEFPVDSQEAPLSVAEAQEYYVNRFCTVGMEDACFAYQDSPERQELVLQHLSLAVHKGEFVAFTGESGCGKSTALKMLLSLYPLQAGRCYLEDHEKRENLTASHRSLFAYVPQGNQLLSGTIRETVAFGDAELMGQEDALWQALRIACADGFVSELPQQLDTPLGERGSGLSEGQLQRLALARAVLSGRPILLLDEATSSLDGPTEKQVLQNLRTMTDRTVLIITHREAALEICDRRIHFE